MLADLLQRRALAEAGDVGVALTLALSRRERGISGLSRGEKGAGGAVAPGVVGVRDAGDVVAGQFAVGAVDHAAHPARVDEQHLARAVAQPASLPGSREEPEAGRYLRRVEELARQRDHAVHQAGLDEVLPYLALSRRVGRHGAVGEDEPGDAARREVVRDVLHPREVGVALRRGAVLPARVVLQALAAPVGDVERGIGEDVVELPVGVQVVVEAVAVHDLAAVDAAHGEVHLGEPPGGVIELLAEDGDVGPGVAAVAVAVRMGAYELDGLHEHAGRAAARVVHPPLVRLQHLDEERDHGAGGVELAALLPLGAGEAGEEVLVHPPQHVARPRLRVADRHVADDVDQAAEPVGVQRRAGVLLRQHAAERRVVPLDGGHRVVQQQADVRLARLSLQVVPPRLRRHPEDAESPVLVRVLRVRAFVDLRFQLRACLLKGVGDVLQEDQPQHDVLVLGGVHAAAQGVGHPPQLVLVAGGRAVRAGLGEWRVGDGREVGHGAG